ncbi:maltose excess protein 1-like, chloroplastic [Selaginella moellendorffii]|uniref:maltose excess protein 1-like, chloroplastic n=1 Tax=Selaginella moellendorffii TaxID=88036 RepID=UPI000D1CA7AF|nr:maltose excess protein 1-like, chloroplastic [Selaginella moellendorffii]|eukprot:XP_024518452.1 maltose excess protein 1-like, chloroplastic [Selaginella moellendorffii]
MDAISMPHSSIRVPQSLQMLQRRQGYDKISPGSLWSSDRASNPLVGANASRLGAPRSSPLLSFIPKRGAPVRCSDTSPTTFHRPKDEKLENETYKYWNATTEQLAGSATLAFLLLQLPQTILNAQNLMAGNNSALFAVSWMSLLTSLMGNLSLLSYFVMKKENGAMIVQAVGVLSTYVVLAQLAIAGSMPSTVFLATSIAVIVGYVINFLNYKGYLRSELWKLWQDIISVGGVSVLSQVMWSTFEPFLPSTILPGVFAFVTTLTLIIQDRKGKLSEPLHKFVGGLAAWSATLLFMWSPVAQMWTNITNPANLRGLSVITVLLAMVGNSLLLPRALFTRDSMWFTGSSWGALVQGWGLLLSMYIYECVSGSVFLGITAGLAFWIGNMLVMDSKANSLSSPFTPLAELLSSTRE